MEIKKYTGKREALWEAIIGGFIDTKGVATRGKLGTRRPFLGRERTLGGGTCRGERWSQNWGKKTDREWGK